MALSRTQARTWLKEAVDCWNRDAPAPELLPNYSVWAHYPVLDAVYIARAVQRNHREILQLLQPIEPIQLRFDLPLPPRVPPDPKYALSGDYVDREAGAFRYFSGVRPTLQAIDIGFRLAGEALATDDEETLTTWFPIVKSSAEWFRTAVAKPGPHRCNGGFSAVGDGTPRVFGSYTAVSCIVSYRRLKNRVSDLPDVDFPFNELLFWIKNWALSPDTDPFFRSKALSTTSYASSVLELMEDNELLPQLLNVRDGTILEGKRLLDMLWESWEGAKGGFRSGPDPGQPTNLGHTRQGLQLLRTLLRRKLIRQEQFPKWLNLGDVLRFVDSCWKEDGNYRGFVNTPEHPVPSIFAERAAINIFKLAEILRLVGLYRETTLYKNMRSVLLSRFADLPKRLSESYIDDVANVCYAYPVTIVIRSQPLSSRLAWALRAGVNLYGHALRHPLEPGYIDRRTGKFISHAH